MSRLRAKKKFKKKDLFDEGLLPAPLLHMFFWQGVLWVRLGARWGADRGPVRGITQGLVLTPTQQEQGDSCVGVEFHFFSFFFLRAWQDTRLQLDVCCVLSLCKVTTKPETHIGNSAQKVRWLFCHQTSSISVKLVTILHNNVLPHARMLHRSARYDSGVQGDRLFSLHPTHQPTTSRQGVCLSKFMKLFHL